MNSISLFNIKIGSGCSGRETITVTNGVASFNGYEVIKTFKNGEQGKKYRNYSFRAYDDTVERILRMKIRPGSEVNIVGELDQYIDKENKRQYFIHVLKIDFVPTNEKTAKNDEKMQEEEPKTESEPVTMGDTNLFNCNIDEDELLFN